MLHAVRNVTISNKVTGVGEYAIFDLYDANKETKDRRLWKVTPENREEVLKMKGKILDFVLEESYYKGNKQYRIISISAVELTPEIIEQFVLKSTKSKEDLVKELSNTVALIDKQIIKDFILHVLFKYKNKFLFAPSASVHHHAYIHGNLEHSIEVALLAYEISKLYPDLDKDLIIAGALLHDIGKIYEYDVNGVINFTDRGKLEGHIAMGYHIINSCFDEFMSRLDEKSNETNDFMEYFRMQLSHIILAHHGLEEYGSFKKPEIKEAFLIHHCDMLSAALGGKHKQ